MSIITDTTWERWKKQINKTAKELNGYQDFSVIDQFIKDKRIILLGESSHGIADYFTSKIDLIRYLHQNHGYNVVVLESGFLEATLCKEFLTDSSPEKQIQNCLLDIYHNKEMLPLFHEEWAKSLKITGMDPQPTYPLISEYMIDWVNKHIDNELYQALHTNEKLYFELDKEMMFKITPKHKKMIKPMIKEYESLLHSIAQKLLVFQEPEKQRMLQIIQQGMQNRLKWLQVNLKGYLSSGIARGSNMFENLEWLMNHYKHEKIIVWAHNFHIRRGQTLITKILGIKSVGYWLQQKYRDEFYSIGLYAGSGKFATQLRVELEIHTTKKSHLELLLYKASNADLFLPLDVTNQVIDKKMWFKRKWYLLESGFMGLSPKVIYPQDQYDAILFIRKVKPPHYFKPSDNHS